MQITDLIILILVIVDLVSLSMVTFIFRWARKAMGNFRAQIMDLLSGETEESNQIIEKLGHTIYSKLYRYFNLQKPDLSSTSSGDMIENAAENIRNASQGSGNIAGMDLSKAAAMMGIQDPAFLKYLPIIMKYFGKNQGNQGSNENINTSNDSW